MSKSFVITAVYTTVDDESTAVETSAYWEVEPADVPKYIAQFTALVHEKSGVGDIAFTYSEIQA